MTELINKLRIFADEIDGMELDDEIKLTSASTLIVLANVLEKVRRDKDEELIEIFSNHLVEFLDHFNDDNESDEELLDFERFGRLLEGIDLDL